MPAVIQAYSESVPGTIALPRHSFTGCAFVAPGTDWREIQFLASRVLYSAQADEVFVSESVTNDVTQTTPVLNQWALDAAFQERDTVLNQLPHLAQYYEGINHEDIGFAALLLAYKLWKELKPQALSSYLNYNRTLHMRADLPQGAVHLSVIFEPGVDPADPIPDEDGDDANAIISFYDTHGVLRAGSNGPLPKVLLELNSLAQ